MRIIQKTILLVCVITIGTLGLFADPLPEQQPEQTPPPPELVTLKLDVAAEGTNFQYSYTQQFTQKPGTSVRLPSRTQLRFNPSHIGFLSAWSDGNVTYKEGETIALPPKDLTLTAIYEEGTLFSDPKHGIEYFSSESTISVPQVPQDDENQVFIGWYDRQTNTLLTEGTYERNTPGAYFEPAYKSLIFTQVGLQSHHLNAVPTNTALTLLFAYRNAGNFVMNNVTSSLKSTDARIHVLDPQPKSRTLRPGESNYQRGFIGRGSSLDSFTFVIDSETPSGSKIDLILSVVDEAGVTFSTTIPLTIR